jgi:ABC-type multidrug transport system permease subunit
MQRVLAIIEREMRRLRRSPMVIIMSLVFPMVQLVILGHAFGGKVRHLKVGLVDQDHGVPAVRMRELSNAIAANAQTFELEPYDDPGHALTALRNGRLNGVLTIPPGFSRRLLSGNAPRVALIEDNTDNFVSATLAGTMSGLLGAYNSGPSVQRIAAQPTLELVEVYPYVPYVQYLLPGLIVMSIFMMVMIGGGIIYLDDKARGLHEGYLVTPISKFELILGFNVSGAIKAAFVGIAVLVIGSVIAGVPGAFAPLRLLRLLVVVVFTSVALVSMMFLLMVRMSNPLLARAMFGVLNTLLYFPSGAVYPQQAFPSWLRAMAVVDPFTYPVHALKNILLKNTGFGAITFDLGYLLAFSAVTMVAATLLFKREL